MLETELSIDKLCLRYCYDGSSQAIDEFKQLQQFKESVQDGSLGAKGKTWVSAKAPFTSICLPLASGAVLFVRYGYVHGRRWSWVEFNPSKLSYADQSQLSTCLDLLFTHGPSTLWKLARIARIDIAVDARHVPFEHHLFLDRRLKASQHQYEGSAYLGSVNGHKSILFYDKQKERWDRSKISVDHPWLRLEARLLNPERWAFNEISAISNPFDTVLVVDKSALLAIDCKTLTPIQARITQGEPLDRIYWELPYAPRCLIWESLQISRAAWWDAQLVWSKYEKAISSVLDLPGLAVPGPHVASQAMSPQ